VHAEQNSPKNAKMNQIPKNASEDTTDVPEDAWEEHAEFVENLNASIIPKRHNAENLSQENAEK